MCYIVLSMIDQATVDRIMDAAQIVDVVSEFVTLRRRGVNYIGLCPFHNEKTPSFSVSPSKGVCKCFSCGKGGNSVHFIMEQEQLTYYEALKFLAKKYGIEIPKENIILGGISQLISEDTAKVTLLVFDSDNNMGMCTRYIRYRDYSRPHFEIISPLICSTCL